MKIKTSAVLLALIALPLLLIGCSRDVDFEQLKQKSAEEIFALGQKAMNEKRYSDAVKLFEELEKLHPYSKLTMRAQLLAGECNYYSKKFDEAIASFEEFVKAHPTHKSVPYALYMVGFINYKQMPIIERDQDYTIEALEYFNRLREEYPSSEYSTKAEKMVAELREHLAGREVYVAKYYMKRKSYAAAIGRLNTVVESYAGIAHVPEAMHRLVECYIAIGTMAEARVVHASLLRQYPQSKWTAYAEALISRYK
ncbi:MAG: outer membrane protein assembly factor BamD [Holosporales bacterium]|jgi:outer membrane protein assembly factor BamD|nr:outer membrane protein assembly factor BamD [Holosporales bacterium]